MLHWRDKPLLFQESEPLWWKSRDTLPRALQPSSASDMAERPMLILS